MAKKLIDASLLANAAGPLARRSIFNLLATSSLTPPKSVAWYNFANADDDEADILIYDEISWWGISASEFVKELKEVKAKTINLHINSPGGSVFDGIAIYNALVQHKAQVIVHIEGWAASIASVIAMCGDVIKIGEAAQVMIHCPWSFVIGNADDMRKEAEVLDSLEDAICDVYVARTGGDKDEIRDQMKAETWFKGQAAVDAGFADEVIPLKLKNPNDAAKPAASMSAEFFATIFPNLPEEVRASLDKDAAPPADTVREFEKFLERSGWTAKAAKKIASNGFKDASDRRDVAERHERPTTPDRRDVAGKRAANVVASAAVLAAIQNATASFPRT